MSEAIFKTSELPFWQRFYKEVEEFRVSLPADANSLSFIKQYELNFIMHTLKSYKHSPKGNGIKWSKAEKDKFMKLSVKEQRKMIVKKSELKSSLFPNINADSKPYEYSGRVSNTAKIAYDKAMKIFDRFDVKPENFDRFDVDIQQEILPLLRLAYKEGYSKAGVALAKCLFDRARFSFRDEAPSQLAECSNIVHALLHEKNPEVSYMYYQLYKWATRTTRLNYIHITPSDLNLNRAEAIHQYNYALESCLWEVIDIEAQREEFSKTYVKAELWLGAALVYKSPLAFRLAASSYKNSDIYALVMYHACKRCAIALGSEDDINAYAYNYTRGLTMLHPSKLKATQMQTYMDKPPKQKGLINGLDPYFDTKFPPDLIIDLTGIQNPCVYGGDKNKIGLVYAREQGLIKDPRDKDSTPDSIKDYYVKMWDILINVYYKDYQKMPPLYHLSTYMAIKIYRNLEYGLPSARPYIFPKEVLDIPIDFKGL
ncbi:hypothetical protein DCO58_07460 [Helicobacter saguini]|uniref:Uncharacterized protein n=1 Tax=Helicobacter saguini TaxID=1548018 RepID=A0A347VNB6_9HELI|nr:hypothetical protein [Helicobacter saguini]MWV61829.1 hypothetical protein [Helicobacter saguini]MWV67496.1 hypothetical protein [Helicobacter saguini]MWV69847.1 hypothetical protein [Helicobacter saguini]MWV72935.1 hypothetical protein [Helicobacter saguini]TLD95681.1 hypothetical protein LS64_002180 [Helicobacter saguini]